MSFVIFMVGLIMGAIVGFVFSTKYFNNEKLTTDDCMEFLHSKGYYVKISRSDYGKR